MCTENKAMTDKMQRGTSLYLLDFQLRFDNVFGRLSPLFSAHILIKDVREQLGQENILIDHCSKHSDYIQGDCKLNSDGRWILAS
jgi:hypothetical protein